MTTRTEVRTAHGRLGGTLSGDRAVRAFKGIPYAAPPVGPLRWRPPRPAPRWDGVRPATAYGPVAPQPAIPATSLYFAGDQSQSEDCLYLNVWGPADPAERRPVIVWFHIGAFLFGSGSAGAGPVSDYDGEALARAGAVVVTVNHRLGRLGFLAHPWLTAESPDGASGNYGLLDQIAALRWVQENIEVFGGDPTRVTVAGVSAGAASISALMTSPLARGLFHRAIAGSGGLFGPVAESCGINDLIQDLPAAERSGVRLGDLLGVRSPEELRALSPQRLASVHPQAERPFRMDFLPVPVGRGDFDTAWPIIDGHAVPPDVRLLGPVRRDRGSQRRRPPPVDPLRPRTAQRAALRRARGAGEVPHRARLDLLDEYYTRRRAS
ncbi:carboxylesterase family protein [Thermocatellispora tengchongensis]|uniref:carboxylesterase family protein n=1 Tax=Thermocatellispora tengchongensis TaxID=1073253 RepID=UPI00364437AC